VYLHIRRRLLAPTAVSLKAGVAAGMPGEDIFLSVIAVITNCSTCLFHCQGAYGKVKKYYAENNIKYIDFDARSSDMLINSVTT
jgi:hypothetical protein